MTAPAPTDERLRVVIDIRTGQAVFGPATQADTATWIIRDGFWRGADLRVSDVPPVSSVCWADPLSGIERAELAGKLSRACVRSFHAATTAPDGSCRCTGCSQVNHGQLDVASECSELRQDVTVRAAVTP